MGVRGAVRCCVRNLCRDKGSFPKGEPVFSCFSFVATIHMHACIDESMINLQPTYKHSGPAKLACLILSYILLYMFTMMTALSRRESWAADRGASFPLVLSCFFKPILSSPGRRRAGPPGRPGTLARLYVSRHSLSHSHVTFQAHESRLQRLKGGSIT